MRETVGPRRSSMRKGRTRGQQRESGQAFLWLSGLLSLAAYALGVGARYWRV
jgi:hypothetical protein